MRTRIAAAAVVSCLLPCLVRSQTLERLRGVWVPTDDRVRLRTIRVTAAGVDIAWDGFRVTCAPSETGSRVTQEIESIVVRCQIPGGVLQVALMRTADGPLVAHFVAPDDQTLQVGVFRRPPTAERPPVISLPTGIPQFPWPPPAWTLRSVLPSGLVVTREGEPLGDVFDRLRSAMHRGGIHEYSVYAVGADGFAVVARLEAIDDEGRPSEDRWSTNVSPPRIFGIGDYIRALFSARPGRYRIIAFVVTALAVTAGPAADRETILRLWRSGAGDLPEQVRVVPLPPSGRCEALVYEFFRPSQDDPPQQVRDSRLTTPLHLARAGLWPLEKLMP